MSYKALTKSIELNNLSEGDIIDRQEYIDKLMMFEKFSSGGGTYITDHRYVEYGEIGLYYYKFTTLIDYLRKFSSKQVKICFSKSFHIDVMEV